MIMEVFLPTVLLRCAMKLIDRKVEAKHSHNVTISQLIRRVFIEMKRCKFGMPCLIIDSKRFPLFVH